MAENKESIVDFTEIVKLNETVYSNDQFDNRDYVCGKMQTDVNELESTGLAVTVNFDSMWP